MARVAQLVERVFHGSRRRQVEPAARPPLLILVIYLAFSSFMLNGPLELAIPYFISATGSTAQTGVGLTMMSLGTVAGGLIITGLSQVRPRMRLLLIGGLLNAAMFLLFGVARSLPLMAGTLFVLMAPLPAGNVLYKSIFQSKVPAGTVTVKERMRIGPRIS